MPILRNMTPRDPAEPHRAATQLELFFDLVTVIAIASSTAAFHHSISAGHGAEDLGMFMLMVMAVWWPWVNHTWFASAFDNDDAVYRVLTIFIMGGYLLFAAGTSYIMGSFDFGFGLLGWIIMRIGMMLLWLRAAAHSPIHRKAAMVYFWGLLFAQTLWTIMHFTVDASNDYALTIAAGIFLIELLVPVLSSRVQQIPWHRHHVIERYGLLNIIVLGEVLLSISFMFEPLYNGHFSWDLVHSATAGLVIVFCVWWIYFIERDHLNSFSFADVLMWAYGHVVIFFAAALLAAGLGAHADVITHHSKITLGDANTYVGVAITLYLLTLWVIRDRTHGLGRKGLVLPMASVFFTLLAVMGAQPWTMAIGLVLTLIARSGIRREN